MIDEKKNKTEQKSKWKYTFRSGVSLIIQLYISNNDHIYVLCNKLDAVWVCNLKERKKQTNIYIPRKQTNEPRMMTQ